MGDRIVVILRGFRRRLLLVRAVEAAAVGGAAAGLTAAALMAGWNLAGRFPLISAGICALPAGAGLVFAVVMNRRDSAQKRRRDSAALRPGLPRRPGLPLGLIKWFITILLIACGFAGTVCVSTGTYVYLSKSWLFLILPSGAFLAFVIVLICGAALRDVAVLVDRRAGLRERLSTALELTKPGGVDEGGSVFVRAVHDQALEAVDDHGISRVGFWNRTRATGGALGLAVVAAVLMLVVEPLESPSARRQRQWQKVSRQAGESIMRQLAAVKDLSEGSDTPTAEQIRRLAELTERLNAAKPEDADRWRDNVVDLNEIADALGKALRSGRLDSRQAGRIERLIDALDKVAAGIADAMTENAGHEYARTGTDGSPPGHAPGPGFTTSRPADASWEPLTVYDPRYAAGADTATVPANGDTTSPKVQIPYDKAWADARRRAVRAVAKGSIPAEYRQLVRDFFDTER